MARKPAVAGAFYPGSKSALKEQVEAFTPEPAELTRAIGIICPHAGLIYSGSVAGLVYASIEPPECFVLLGPNHTGLGRAASMMDEGAWEIPTGTVAIDSALAGRIKTHAPLTEVDSSAHMFEHSLEVQLPFILRTAPGATMVPIAIMSASLPELMELGRGIASAVKEDGRRIVVAASSDMSHFISDEEARELDKLAIDMILALDPEGLHRVVTEMGITMCGVMPATAMLSASLALGARKAELMRYTTSAETSGDYDRVVGYAGIVIS